LGKKRVYVLAKELGITSRRALDLLKEIGIQIKSHMSVISEEVAKELEEKVKKESVEQALIELEQEEKAKKQEVVEEKEEEEEFIYLPEKVSVKELAEILSVSRNELVKKLMTDLGIISINQRLDFETAELIAEDYGFKVKLKESVEKEKEEDEYAHYKRGTRPPVITVMGHVDHGKTSILDVIRKSSVVAQEAGGITQHIGAYQVKLPDGKVLTFLDTPGHEAFTAMRAHGAKVTDLVILVVAADDGVQPQTIEAIDHCIAADVPYIVAINKIDKDNANVEKVKQELSNHGAVIEEWGGNILAVEVSAKQNINIDELLEMAILKAETDLDLTARIEGPAEGVVIEAYLSKGRGPVATVLVKEGILQQGDVIVVGSHYGKVRSMVDEHNRRLKLAGPSTPVEISGLSGVPKAGDKFKVYKNEKMAKKVAEYRRNREKEEERSMPAKVTLQDFFKQLKEQEQKELNIVLKVDVHGSKVALTEALLKLKSENVEVKIIHAGIGAINESDVMLAAASNAIIIGFNVRPKGEIIKLAEEQKVEIRTYNVIYHLLEDVEKAMKGMLAPTYKEEMLGQAEVRATFKIPNVGVIAGSYVTTGKIVRDVDARLIRDGIVIYDGKISSLKRFKEDVKEVASGYECGIGLNKFNDIKVGDIIEAFTLVEEKR